MTESTDVLRRQEIIYMESTILVIIGVIVLLIVLSLVLKGLGFALRILTNPKVLLIALVIFIAVYVTMKMSS